MRSSKTRGRPNWWLKGAATLWLLFTTIKYLRPILMRELLLKYSIRLNKYEQRTDIPHSCFQVSNDSPVAMTTLDYDQYSGIWYNFATNDPTQPGDLCRCDRYKWTYNGPETNSFESELNIICKGLGVFRMQLQGQANVTGIAGKITEGSPAFGADLIPGYIVWVDKDYSATIRYFCAHNYLGVDVFSSIQIWTREPTSRTSKKGRSLLGKAHELLQFDEKYLDFADHSDCEKLPSVSR